MGLPTKLRLVHLQTSQPLRINLKLCSADPFSWGSRLPKEDALQQTDTVAWVMKRVGHIVAFGVIQFGVKILTRWNCFSLKNWNHWFISHVSVMLTVRLNNCVMSSFLRHLQDILGDRMDDVDTTLPLLWNAKQLVFSNTQQEKKSVGNTAFLRILLLRCKNII